MLTNFQPACVDFQLSPKNTLTVNYRYFQIGERNDGVDTQSLPSQAYNANRHHHNIQLMDTQMLSPRVVNETSFQYLHFHNAETPQDFSPTINVLGAFTGGGDSSGSFNRYETHYTFQNYTTMTLSHHLVRFGGTLVDLPRRESTNGRFQGTFTFDSLANYQQTEQGLRNGLAHEPRFRPRAMEAESVQHHRGQSHGFHQPEWMGRSSSTTIGAFSPHFTASYGLRFESENVISDHAKTGRAPRVGIAWELGHGSNTKTVLRAGWGIFYERLDDDQMIMAARLNGQNQLTYIVNRPAFFPTPPSISELSAMATSSPTIFRISPDLHSPYDMDAAVSLERQLLPSTTVSLTYINSRGIHQFLTNDINAPLPGTFNPSDPTSGVTLGNAAGNVYEYQSPGIYKQTQFIANIHVHANRISLFGYYVFDDAHSDADLNLQSNPAGEITFQTNPWNISADYGRATFDVRHRVLIGGSYELPLGIRLSSADDGERGAALQHHAAARPLRHGDSRCPPGARDCLDGSRQPGGNPVRRLRPCPWAGRCPNPS